MPSEYCGKQQSGICIWPLGRLRTTETSFGAEITTVGRVRNPKIQLLQIDLPTIVGCSLWYPIARYTTKPEARLLSSQKYRF